MTAVPVLADRVMKARRETTCTLCSCVIRTGQLIARCPGGLWVHCSCFIGHRHNLDDDQDASQ
jgi:hypothetical protein